MRVVSNLQWRPLQCKIAKLLTTMLRAKFVHQRCEVPAVIWLARYMGSLAAQRHLLTSATLLSMLAAVFAFPLWTGFSLSDDGTGPGRAGVAVLVLTVFAVVCTVIAWGLARRNVRARRPHGPIIGLLIVANVCAAAPVLLVCYALIVVAAGG